MCVSSEGIPIRLYRSCLRWNALLKLHFCRLQPIFIQLHEIELLKAFIYVRINIQTEKSISCVLCLENKRLLFYMKFPKF